MVARTVNGMMISPDAYGHEPYDEPRVTCPVCDSSEVTHLVIGMPPGPDAMDGDPEWVEWIGCSHPGYERECHTCGSTWSPDERGVPTPLRLLSAVGASFALLPTPDPIDILSPAGHRVDIELLSPDRLVRYLGRYLPWRFPSRLAAMFLQAAQEPHPELTVDNLHEPSAGLSIAVIESTSFAVALEILVRTGIDDETSEPDGLTFDIQRVSLIDAAHKLEEWP